MRKIKLIELITASTRNKVIASIIAGTVVVGGTAGIAVAVHNSNSSEPVKQEQQVSSNDSQQTAKAEDTKKADEEKKKAEEQKKADEKKADEKKKEEEKKNETAKNDSEQSTSSSNSSSNSNSSSSNSSSNSNSSSSNSSSNSNSSSSNSGSVKSSSSSSSSNTSKSTTSYSQPKSSSSSSSSSKKTTSSNSNSSSQKNAASAPKKSSRPSGFDAQATNAYNGVPNSYMAYCINPSYIEKLRNATINYARYGFVPDDAKEAIDHRGRKIVFTGKTAVPTFFSKTIGPIANSNFRIIDGDYDGYGIHYAVFFWNADKNGWDVKCVTLDYKAIQNEE